MLEVSDKENVIIKLYFITSLFPIICLSYIVILYKWRPAEAHAPTRALYNEMSPKLVAEKLGRPVEAHQGVALGIPQGTSQYHF